MTSKRKTTIQTSICLDDTGMEDAAALSEIVRSVMVTAGRDFEDEIRQALSDAGAKDVSVSMTAH